MAIALAGERRFLERLKSEEEATVVYTAPKERFMKRAFGATAFIFGVANEFIPQYQ